MSKKKHGNWRGRPNEPPLNWHTPGKPVIRKVSGSLADLPPVPRKRSVRPNVTKKMSRPPASPGRPTPRGKTDLITVRLPKKQWIIIFKALNFYDKTHGDASSQKWWRRVRETILDTISYNNQDAKSSAANFVLEDWRIIWKQVRIACQERGDECVDPSAPVLNYAAQRGPGYERGDEWVVWFDWLSDTMTKQIKGA